MKKDCNTLSDTDEDVVGAYLLVWDRYMHTLMRHGKHAVTTVPSSRRWPDAVGVVYKVGLEDPTVAAHMNVLLPKSSYYSRIHDWIERIMKNAATDEDTRAFLALIRHFIFKLTMLFVHCARQVSPIEEGLTVFRGMNIEVEDGAITIQNPSCSFVSTSIYAYVAAVGDFVSGNCFMIIRVSPGVPALYVPGVTGDSNIAKSEHEMLLAFAQVWTVDRAWRRCSNSYVMVCTVRPAHQTLFVPHDAYHKRPNTWRRMYNMALHKRDCRPLTIPVDASPPDATQKRELLDSSPPSFNELEDTLSYM